MRKALVSLAGALGLIALYRALRRRTAAPSESDPVDELRATIADAKTTEEQHDEPGDEPSSPEERRRLVHERAQEAIDAMQDPPPAA